MRHNKHKPMPLRDPVCRLRCGRIYLNISRAIESTSVADQFAICHERTASNQQIFPFLTTDREPVAGAGVAIGRRHTPWFRVSVMVPAGSPESSGPETAAARSLRPQSIAANRRRTMSSRLWYNLTCRNKPASLIVIQIGSLQLAETRCRNAMLLRRMDA